MVFPLIHHYIGTDHCALWRDQKPYEVWFSFFSFCNSESFNYPWKHPPVFPERAWRGVGVEVGGVSAAPTYQLSRTTWTVLRFPGRLPRTHICEHRLSGSLGKAISPFHGFGEEQGDGGVWWRPLTLGLGTRQSGQSSPLCYGVAVWSQEVPQLLSASMRLKTLILQGSCEDE